MRDIAYYNGKIGRIDEVQAPITDRGFYFGDGVYDAAMVNNKKIFVLEDHLDRFYNSLKLLRIEPPMLPRRRTASNANRPAPNSAKKQSSWSNRSREREESGSLPRVI